jgi:hypothetical protein
MNNEFRREVSTLRASATLPPLQGLGLLNSKLMFGTAWFWTLPEVHDVQQEIDALCSQFRRYIGINVDREMTWGAC